LPHSALPGGLNFEGALLPADLLGDHVLAQLLVLLLDLDLAELHDELLVAPRKHLGARFLQPLHVVRVLVLVRLNVNVELIFTQAPSDLVNILRLHQVFPEVTLEIIQVRARLSL